MIITQRRQTLEMGLVGIGLILVLGVILGADANDAHVIPLGPSPPPFLARKGQHLSSIYRARVPDRRMFRCVTFWERSHSGLVRPFAKRASP